MTAGAERRSDPIPPPVTCAAKGGCSYLRALATIERLAGFETTAKRYAAKAARCQEQGCWAASRDAARTMQASVSEPIRIDTAVTSRKSSLVLPPPRQSEPIPFSRSALSDVVRDGLGNYVQRRVHQLENLTDPAEPLGYLFQYWRNLRVSTDCRFSDIDIVQLMRAEIVGKLHVVDVSNSNPEEFRFELFGYAVPLVRCETVRNLPVAIYAETTMEDYNAVRRAAAPRLDRVRSCLDGVNYHYTRLILPFSDRSHRVARLLVGIRQEPGDGLKIESTH